MPRIASRTALAIGLALLVCGLIPIAVYWSAIGRAPAISPVEAVSLLNQPGSKTLLVDVRETADFEANHLEGAVGWPYEEIMALSSGNSSSEMPADLRGKPLLLICHSGINSARAVLHLRGIGITNALSVSGGMQEWIASVGGQAPQRTACRLRSALGVTGDLPFRESARIEQWTMLSTFWAIKPFYMLLSLALIVVLRRVKAPDLVALRWGLVFFLAGEAFCYANFFLFADASHLFEYFHSYGMVLSFAFATYALLEGMDRRLIKYSDPNQKCAALGLCRSCPKYTEAPCGLKRVFLYLTPACAVLCFLPLTAEPHWVSYNSRILWVFYNYSHLIVYQLFEIRACPLFALAMFLAAFGILLLAKRDPVRAAKIFFSAGTGYLGFGLFRLFLFAPYRDNVVWFTFWEEVTELLYICGVAFILAIFRHRLFDEVRE